MTGFTIRTQLDDGTVADLDIDQLSDDQLKSFVESRREDDRGWQWVVALARWIRENVRDDRDVVQTGAVQGEDLPALQEAVGEQAAGPVLEVLRQSGNSQPVPNHE